MNIRKIIKETIHKALLKEYFDGKPQRLPFGDDFYEDEHIYDYINWLKQAGKIGKLPKPKITWDEGLKKGCIEYVKKYGAPESRYKIEDSETSKVIYKLYKEVKERLNPVVMFDDNGNLYVERAITVDNSTNYFQLIKDYQNNPGGCWSLKVDSAQAYCGWGDDAIVLHGYMCLDDIFWAELIRKTTGGYQDEWEVRTYPNGKVEVTALHVNGNYVNLQNEPIIINSTYFGNRTKFKGDYAPLGYKGIGYEYKFIDREGNLMKDFSKILTQKFYNYEKTGKLNDKFGEMIIKKTPNPSLFLVGATDFGFEQGVRYNVLNTKTNRLVSPDQWFCSVSYNFLVFSKYFKVRNEEQRENLMDENGNFLWKGDEWLDSIEDEYDKDYVTINYNDKYNFMNADGDILWKPNDVSKWFDYAFCFGDSDYAAVVFERDDVSRRSSNYLTKQGELLYKNPNIDEWPSYCDLMVDGFGVVQFGDGTWNFMKENGGFLLPYNMHADLVYHFSHGVAPIGMSYDCFEFINTKGKKISGNIWFDMVDKKDGQGSPWIARNANTKEWYMITDKGIEPIKE